MAESYYCATLMARAHMIVEETEGPYSPQVFLNFGGKVLPVKAYKRLRAYLQEHPPEAVPYTVKLWPKTTPEGYLTANTELRVFKPVEDADPEEFYALGKLTYIDRDEARFGIRILPNPRGMLGKPFLLSIAASLELLESLPEEGAGLEVWGELRPKSLRLMVKRFEVVPLPATRPLVPIPNALVG
jgi:hypothetical protein